MWKHFLFLLFLVTELNATNYFVDYVSGADTNAGTSSGAAWKHCPGDPAATNTAASATFSAGDNVFFKGGVSYVFTGATGIVCGQSGSVGNPITYDGNSAGTFGTGRAILTDNYGANNIKAFTVSSRSNITINYFAPQNIGGSAVLPTDTGSAVAERPGTFVSGTTVTNITVSNNTINGMGYVYNQKPMDSGSITGTGITFINSSGHNIFGNDFTRCSNPVYLLWSNNTSVAGNTHGNTFHNWIKWAYYEGNVSGASSGVVIPANGFYGNQVYDFPEWDTANWTGYGGHPHTDAIFYVEQFPSDTNTWTGSNNYNNKYYQTPGNAGDGSAFISITEGPSVNIYNNQFLYAAQNGRTIYIHNGSVTAGSSTVRIINNSFIGTGGQCVNLESDNGNFTKLNFYSRNNLYSSLTVSGSTYCWYGAYSGSLQSFDSDYDMFNSANTYQRGLGNWGGTQDSDFIQGIFGFGEGGITQLRASSQQAHGDSNDPLYVTVNADATLCNVNLQAGSPARNFGVNLTALGLPGLTSDYAGAARPSSGPWDAGAYQNSSGTPTFSSSFSGKITVSGKVAIH